jgi:hypothetical protein
MAAEMRKASEILRFAETCPCVSRCIEMRRVEAIIQPGGEVRLIEPAQVRTA